MGSTISTNTTTENEPELPSFAYTLTNELLTEVQSSVSYHFTHAASLSVQEATGKIIPPERSITLYCPHRGELPIIDEVVKIVASRERAHILVLDALELAAGKFGALGEGRVLAQLKYLCLELSTD